MPPSGPQNGIVGSDANYGLDLPETQVDDSDFKELQNTARYAESTQYKKLRSHLESRVTFYKTQLPGGQPVTDVDPDIAARMWQPAVTIINELTAIIEVYDAAVKTAKSETVKREAAKRVR